MFNIKPTVIEKKHSTFLEDSNPELIKKREQELEAYLTEQIPDFVKTVKSYKEEAEIVLHQDAFAAGYQKGEYTLLGMAVKYAGLHGITLTIIGRNRSTLSK